MIIYEGCPKKRILGFSRKDWMIFSKTDFKKKLAYSKKVTGPSIFAKPLIAARDVLKTWLMG